MRIYPPPSTDALISFVYNTLRMERIPITFEEIRLNMGKKDGDIDTNPHCIGHFKAVNFALQQAKDPDALKTAETWLKRLHSNVMVPIVAEDIKTMNPQGYPKDHCGAWRLADKFMANRRMPNPMRIPVLMQEWRQRQIAFDQKIAQKLTNPRLFSPPEIEEIAKQCYDAGLELACIKPFSDGSNRVARLTENLLRLHWTLPWKIIPLDSKDRYIKDLQTTQQRFPY